MIELNNNTLAEQLYSNIFIVESRNEWETITCKCNKLTDLVLCIDFGLNKKLQDEGYRTAFLDHLVKNTVLEQLNFKMHAFLDNWYRDKNGNDLLNYKGLDMGDAHLLFIINEIGYFCHFFFNLITLKYFRYQKLIVAVNDETVHDCLAEGNFLYESIEKSAGSNFPVYSFPILKWVSEKTKRPGLSYTLKNALANCFDFVFRLADPVFNRHKKIVYVHRYHPTMALVNELGREKNIQLAYNNYSGLKNILHERRIHYRTKKKSAQTKTLISNFKANRYYTLSFDGLDIKEHLYTIIDKVLNKKLEYTIHAADSILTHLKKRKIDLMVPITNLWVENRLLMKFCRANNVPVFMIINGILASSFYNDAKDSDYVNCYSESIKREYFNNAANAIPLGDPRMDGYADLPGKEIDYTNPTFVIGTAGFNPIDLNSYLAFEFNFLYDILLTINELNNAGKKIDVILKIRGNGYSNLYESFVAEYFPGFAVEFIQEQPFKEVIKRADLYISIYSQTLFEASCMGIPVIYYKKDTQFIHKPFDGDSELVSPHNKEELNAAFRDFFEKHPRFELFKRKEVMEKYIGYLDGKNTRRNAEFILNLLSKANVK